MTPTIVDASVALKWCLPPGQEALVLQADQLLASYRAGVEQFIVPDLFWMEVANALWKAVRKQKIDSVRAEKALRLVDDLEINTIPSQDLVPLALQLAVAHDRTVYDCIYVALAVRAKGILITADERLANSLAARFPVKWLGAF